MACDGLRVFAHKIQLSILLTMVLGIVCALPYEAKPLIGGKTVIGKVYSVGPAAFLAVSGAGSENATKATEYLLGKGVDALISWGLAGGLKPGLAAGDVVLAEQLLTDHGAYAVSRSWRKALRKRLADFTRVYDGALVHSEGVLSRPTDKQLLHDSCAAIAVDRESAAVAEVARKAKVPFLALKVIADTADLRLPAVLSRRLMENGELKLGQLLAGIGARPWQWPATFKLTRNSRIGLAKLKYMADKLNRDLAPSAALTRSGSDS
jgi:adenosylhomocysteine nucleosidase